MVKLARTRDIEMFVDGRGWVMATDRAFKGLKVAYCYATMCQPGQVKGWHKHAEHEDRLFCVSGLARVVVAEEHPWKHCLGLYSKPCWNFHEETIGPVNSKLIVVPPGLWHAFHAALAGRGDCR